MKKKIRVCHVNITSILLHKHELVMKYFECDIISINETYLSNNKHCDLPGFTLFRNDGLQRRGSGVLLAIRNNIKAIEVVNKTEDDNEIIAIEIISKEMGKILVASLYVHPHAKKIKSEWLQDLYNVNRNCIIVGDLNAALQSKGSNKTNMLGRKLLNILNDGFLSCIEDKIATYEKKGLRRKTRLDISVTSTVYADI